tara:strand:+ start:101 stop:307 length:207 start_codon:yes stop_codon:yes gene_type:complete
MRIRLLYLILLLLCGVILVSTRAVKVTDERELRDCIKDYSAFFKKAGFENYNEKGEATCKAHYKIYLM